MPTMMPFLMFQGRAEEAVRFYVALFRDGEVLSLTPGEPSRGENAGTGLQARIRLAGQELMIFDSPAAHGFGFTPAISLFVTCEDAAEVDRLFEALSTGGGVLMPLGEYPFSRRFAWVSDRFGVSWQLSAA